jgi:hypothetical protein
MRRLTLSTLLLALCCCATSARQQTDREQQGFVGPVKTVSAESIEPADNSGSVKEPERRRPLDTVTFDEQGREVSRVIYDDYSFLVGTQTNTYDAKGRLAESSLKAEEKERQLREVYKYDDASRLIEKLSYEGENADALKETFSYDAQGRVDEIVLSYRGEVGGKTKFKYDGKGKVIEVAFYTAGGQPAVAPVGPCFGAHRLTYVHDARGRVIEEHAFKSDNSLKRKTVYGYDDKGNILKESRNGQYGSDIFTHSYEFDPRGNWTQQKTRIVSQSSLTPGDPGHYERTLFTRRTITYY